MFKMGKLGRLNKYALLLREETGGGYYGNTSGSFLKFKLPNTGVTGRIPLCKFVVNTPDTTIPFGRGVLPDYPVLPTIGAFINNLDTEMELAKKLMSAY